jgi:hypothetical protein
MWRLRRSGIWWFRGGKCCRVYKTNPGSAPAAKRRFTERTVGVWVSAWAGSKTKFSEGASVGPGFALTPEGIRDETRSDLRGSGWWAYKTKSGGGVDRETAFHKTKCSEGAADQRRSTRMGLQNEQAAFSADPELGSDCGEESTGETACRTFQKQSQGRRKRLPHTFTKRTHFRQTGVRSASRARSRQTEPSVLPFTKRSVRRLRSWFFPWRARAGAGTGVSGAG